ncbi:MAG: peptidylprolyl isomerase [Pseudomonas sp.]|nr:peptidylprolyl isomerase [Pseudomonas sp.]
MPFKRILTLCVFAMVPSFTMAASPAQSYVVENELVQVSEAELRTITQALLQTGQIPADKLSAAHVEKAAKDFMLYKALAGQAQAQGLDQSPEAQKLVEMMQQRMLGNLYLKDYVEHVALPDFNKVALENYIVNKKQFEQAETVKAQHILIGFEGDEAAALQRAKDVRAQVLAGKQTFAELAKEHSSDPSAKSNGGDLGFFDNKAMVPEFSKVAFALKAGEVSDPVKSQFGWHVIQVLEKKPSRFQPFAEVEEQLVDTATQTFKRNARAKKLEETVYSPGLKVDQAALEKIANDLLSK